MFSGKEATKITRTATFNDDKDFTNDDELSNGRHSKGSSSSKKRSKIEERHIFDQACINKLRKKRKDYKGTKKLLKGYISWHKRKAAGAYKEKNVVTSKEKMDKLLKRMMHICRSQAWDAEFKSDIEKYPNNTVILHRKNLPPGAMEHLNTCQACNRQKRLWSVKVRLDGQPYKRGESYQEGQSKYVDYYMGSFCYERTKLFHNIYHFEHVLYQRIKKRKKSNGKTKPDEELFREMFAKLKGLMKDTDQDYTKDGKRGNWRYESKYKCKKL